MLACSAGRALALSLLEQRGGERRWWSRDHDVMWQDHKKKIKSVMLQQFFVRDLLVAHALDSHLFDGEEVLRGTDHCRCKNSVLQQIWLMDGFWCFAWEGHVVL